MNKFHILFVCMGNICRSPAAEGVFRKMIEDAGLKDRVRIDSAGTISHHTGEPPDPRMSEAAAARGYRLNGRARRIKPSDFKDFDLILTMDRKNHQDVLRLHPEGESTALTHPFCDFCTTHAEAEVPDPYYGGYDGFDRVLDLLEDGCSELLAFVQKRIAKK